MCDLIQISDPVKTQNLWHRDDDAAVSYTSMSRLVFPCAHVTQSTNIHVLTPDHLSDLTHVKTLFTELSSFLFERVLLVSLVLLAESDLQALM